MRSKWGPPQFYLLFATGLLVAGCGQAPASEGTNSSQIRADIVQAPPSRFPAAAVQKAKAALAAEPQVKDLLFQDSGPVEWQVGVVSDGSPRFGFAEYLCSIVREQGAGDDRTVVRVVDIGKVAAGADFRAASLGTVQCGDGARLDSAPAAGA
jgi:hypothetical protein